MDRIEYRDVVDRSGWPHGPWDGEPDKAQWPDAATGLPCMIRRIPSLGHLCGYVGVPPGHPLHGKSYDEVDDGLEAHGGVTFSGQCDPGGDPRSAICHVAAPGEPDPVWWFAFDCAHGGDRVPGLEARLGERLAGWPSTYRDWAYVEEQCRDLAGQLAAIKPPSRVTEFVCTECRRLIVPGGSGPMVVNSQLMCRRCAEIKMAEDGITGIKVPADMNNCTYFVGGGSGGSGGGGGGGNNVSAANGTGGGGWALKTLVVEEAGLAVEMREFVCAGCRKYIFSSAAPRLMSGQPVCDACAGGDLPPDQPAVVDRRPVGWSERFSGLDIPGMEKGE